MSFFIISPSSFSFILGELKLNLHMTGWIFYVILLFSVSHEFHHFTYNRPQRTSATFPFPLIQVYSYYFPFHGNHVSLYAFKNVKKLPTFYSSSWVNFSPSHWSMGQWPVFARPEEWMTLDLGAGHSPFSAPQPGQVHLLHAEASSLLSFRCSWPVPPQAPQMLH